MPVDIGGLREIAAKRDRYLGQLDRLRKIGKQTTSVEAAVSSACETLQSGTTSFVIYGEPQSGKTEMMICLTAKLLDDGYRIHTSGKKLDHKSDKKPIDDVMNALSDVHSRKFEAYMNELGKIAGKLYGDEQTAGILGYIVKNCDQTTTIIMNSERDKNVDFKSATSPAAMFTFVIGGNRRVVEYSDGERRHRERRQRSRRTR